MLSTRGVFVQNTGHGMKRNVGFVFLVFVFLFQPARAQSPNELRWGGVGRAILITLTSDHEIGPPTRMAPRSVVG